MAAFTQKELEISNKSYTNKDFEAVYTELLTYAQKLSTRFSPADSNEADPFVILLKLAAFVADKVNYNVDKNILEGNFELALKKLNFLIKLLSSI